jgi:tetratricopeptide (TPR) repeat protein
MLGISYGMLKRSDDSREMFQRLVTVGGETQHLHLLLGKAYFALGQNQKAESEFQQAACGKSLPYAHYYIGVLYQKLGRIDDATLQFEQEIKIAPDNPWAYRDLSEMHLDRADTTGAIALLEKGTRINPNAPELFDVMGRAYLRTKDFDKAIAALQRATALDRRNGAYHAQLSRACLAAGKRSQADSEMARARALMTQGSSAGSMKKISRDRSTATSVGDAVSR